MRNKVLLLFITALLILTFKAFSTAKPKKIEQIPSSKPTTSHLFARASALFTTKSSDGSGKINDEVKTITHKANDIDPKALKLALNAYHKVEQKGLIRNPYLTVIDYSKASNKKRMWVIDMANKSIPFHTYVAHGKGSGLTTASHFSNQGGSHSTSLGVYLTEQSYVGGHVGYALGLHGLEKGVNDHAASRAVVVHGARYVDESFIKHNGRAGRSWGCPSIPTALARPLINAIKNGSVLFAYYPDSSWLSHSKFLS